MKRVFQIVCVTALVAALGSAASAADITHDGTTISMDFVTVGNAGNTADATSYGGVDYNYRIGKYEVTENQWDAVSGASTTDLLDDPGYWSGDQPVAEISWHESAMFCNWLTSGNVAQGAYAINGSGVVTAIDRADAVSTYGTVYVIPTEDEWYKAAYYDPNKSGGAGYWDYPTGSDSAPDGIDFAGDTEFEAVFYDEDHQGHPNDMDDAGALSPYGTMGQGGNVWEWNETLIGSYRGLRGGSFGDVFDVVYLRASDRGYGYPTYEFLDIGFRVSEVPEPATMAILMLGGIGILRRRKCVRG
jgi:formylglycine-generating enzyme required for sulfatase activity